MELWTARDRAQGRHGLFTAWGGREAPEKQGVGVRVGGCMDIDLGLGDALEILPSRSLFSPKLQGCASVLHPDPLEVGGCFYSPTFVLG